MGKKIHLEKNQRIGKISSANKIGHIRKKCRLLKREQGEGNKNERTNIVAAKGDVTIICYDSCVSFVW